MVNSKLGTTFLPQMAIDAGILNDTDLVVMTPPGEAPYRDIGLVWRQTTSRILTFRTLGLMIQKLLTKKNNKLAATAQSVTAKVLMQLNA